MKFLPMIFMILSISALDEAEKEKLEALDKYLY